MSHSIIIHPASTPTISELVDLIIYCLYPCETNISKILDQYLKPFLTYSNLKFEKFHSLTSPKSVINLNTFTWWGLVFLFTIIKTWNLQYYSFKQWRIQICNQICCKTNSSMKKNQLNMDFVKKLNSNSELLSQKFFKSAKILDINCYTIWKPLYGSA